jgi:hypothetical protein
MIHAPNGKTYKESYLRSETGNRLTKYVNLCQSPEERRDKYAFCRFFGIKACIARSMRDWHWTKIQPALEALTNPHQLELTIVGQRPRPAATDQLAITTK